MTEAEWLACTDPTPMLKILRGKASERKLRLFAAACCWKIWPLLTARHSSLLDHERRAVAVAEQNLVIAEQYADRLIKRAVIDTAYCDVLNLLFWRRPEQEPWAFALVAVLRATSTGSGYYGQMWEYDEYDAFLCAGDVGNYIATVAAWASKRPDDLEAMYRAEAAFLRCILGNPFRPVTLDPAWLAWNDGTIQKLAQAIYDDRAFDRLPVLADALEEAGCDNAEILNHCRQLGEHVRGCWLVDLLLGK
jgi:hypothetical protein